MDAVFAQLGALSVTDKEVVQKLEMVALPRSEMTALDVQIVDFVVGMLTLRVMTEDVDTVMGRLLAVEVGLAEKEAVSLYCLYAWVAFRQHTQYLHGSLYGTALYEPVNAWFTKWMTGEERQSIEGALSAGAFLMSISKLSDEQTKKLHWYFAVSGHLMDFVVRYM